MLHRLPFPRRVRTPSGSSELGQTTAEYALVILGAAAVATMLVTWATQSHAIEHLFDTVIDRVL